MPPGALLNSTLLDIYEAGVGQPAALRALTLLAAAYPEESSSALGRLTPGQRDGRLLAVRQATFGNDLHSVTACPACGAALEFSVSAASLLAACSPGPGPDALEGLAECQGHKVHFRLPTSQDLARITPGDSIQAARAGLLASCLLSASQDGAPVALAALPEPVVAEVSRRMAELDPGGDLALDLACPACGHAWQAAFDVAAYLWEEIRQRAGELLREVLLLAHASGWSEGEILALSPWRRRAYLGIAYE